MQGDDDMNVDFDDGVVLARALQTRRPQIEFVQQAVPGQTHEMDENIPPPRGGVFRG